MRKKLCLAAAVFLLATALRLLFPALAGELQHWWEAATDDFHRTVRSAGALLAPTQDERILPVLQERERG